MKKILSILLFLMAVTMGYAQDGVVKGKVTDANGEPLIGATVKPVGGKTGTITDIDGNYSFKTNAKVLEISYVGCRTARVTVKNGRADAQLADDTNTLNEVVAIGYGSVKKGDVTNAVAQIKGDELADRPVTNIGQALQGELAGVEVQSSSGAPGSSVQVKVRGAASINEDGNSNPLYVVDGIPMDEDFDLSQLNPNDIQSIEVLKDASSSAIYGSRGANGVVLISCKKGENNEGKVDVKFGATFSISNPERKMPMMSAAQWIAMRSAINNNQYVNTYGDVGATSSDSYAQRIAITGNANSTYVNDPRWTMAGYGGLNAMDWQNAMFQTGIAQKYDVSITQGNKKSSYRASASFTNQSGIVINTGFKRITLNLSGQTTIADKLTLGLNITPQMVITDGGGVGGQNTPMQTALTAIPITESEAGLQTGAEPYQAYRWSSSSFISPVAIMNARDYRDEQIRIVSSLSAKYQFNKSLRAEVLGSWIFNNQDTHTYLPSSVAGSWDSNSEGYRTTANYKATRSHKYLLQATSTYDHTWAKKHHLNVVAGWSLEATQNGVNLALNETQFPNNYVQTWTINSNTESKTKTMQYTTDDHLLSYFARVEYGYDSRYLINASIRRDGSSRFGTNNKWGTFPAVSVAWRMSNEKFWQPTWVMNQAKLRVSYGSNGSNSISLNAADGMLSATNYTDASGNVVTGYVPTSTDNVNLGWQKTNSWNIGIDMSFFRNRISFAVDYYVKNISDMLYQMKTPTITGQSSAWSNVGNIRTQGLELELKTENLVGKFKWTTKASVGYSKNEVTDLGQNAAFYAGFTTNGSTQIVEVGHPLGEYYLYIADGIYANEEDLAKYPKTSTATVGEVRYRDINGDGVINEDDRTYCGKPQPSWIFGLTNTFKWKNWDASFLITAQCGGKIWSAMARATELQGGQVTINLLERAGNQWISESQPGDGTQPRTVGASYELYSTRWLYSSDFIKLKNITIGYRFSFPKKCFVKALRLNFSAENVFMIDAYPNGYSPEANTGSTTSVLKAYDYASYPLSRTFSLGAQVQF